MTPTQRRNRSRSGGGAAVPASISALFVSCYLLSSLVSARRGALVKDGMNSKSFHENPMMYGQTAGGIDPDVIAITTKAPTWAFDAIPPRVFDACRERHPEHSGAIDAARAVVAIGAGGIGKRNGVAVTATLRSKPLSGGKRFNWMRATAIQGDPKHPSSKPLRAVWTCSNADEEESTDGGTRGRGLLSESYEDCIKRYYGKFVEVEVLLSRSGGIGGSPPPSIVYRVPIKPGTVNPIGMVSKSRASAILYPNGRKMAGGAGTAASTGGKRMRQPVARSSADKDAAIPLGLTNVHLPLGPGLVDPGWVKGRKIFWEGRPVGLV